MCLINLLDSKQVEDKVLSRDGLLFPSMTGPFLCVFHDEDTFQQAAILCNCPVIVNCFLEKCFFVCMCSRVP